MLTTLRSYKGGESLTREPRRGKTSGRRKISNPGSHMIREKWQRRKGLILSSQGKHKRARRKFFLVFSCRREREEEALENSESGLRSGENLLPPAFSIQGGDNHPE